MEAAQEVPTRARASRITAATLLLGVAAVTSMVLLATLGATVLNDPVHVAAAIAIGLFHLVLALIVVRRARGNAVAVLLAAMALVMALTNIVRDDAAPVLVGTWMLLYLPLALVLLIVPSGSPWNRRWALTGRALCLVVAAFLVLGAAQALWPEAAGVLSILALILLAGFLGLLIACAVAPFLRYRAAGEVERLQLRWLLAAGLSLPLTLLLCWTSYLVLGVPDLVAFGLLAMLLVIPAGATIALTRPLLFDADRATVAAVTALSLLTVGLVALTIFSVAARHPLSEWDAVPAAVTGGVLTLAAVVGYPFARRGFDRILYPDRARAIAGLRQLSVQVDAGSAAPEDVQRVLRDALRDPGLVVAYRRLADRALIGLDGTAVAVSSACTPVRARGEEIGAIVPSAARPHRPSRAVVRAATPLVDAVRSRSELASATAEVEASRRRLLRAGYEERRRLERDLHDGAQQRLVALGMQLRVLQRTMQQHPAMPREREEPESDPSPQRDLNVAESLDTAVAELGTAVAELRRLAHGVRPSALDDGLGAALAELERLSPEVIELDVRAERLPDVVAVTAYFVVSEAVTNALRHSGATRIRIVVRRTGDDLRVQVADDGRGGAVARAVGGLTGLSDRVQALGGAWTLRSEPHAGTTVEAVLPCAS